MHSQRGKQWPLWNRPLLFTNNNKTKLALLYKQSWQGIFARLRAPLPERGMEIFARDVVFMAELSAMLFFARNIKQIGFARMKMKCDAKDTGPGVEK